MVAMPPTRSVRLMKKSRTLNFFFRCRNFASWMMSAILTFEGQAISQRLQLEQYLSESSTRSGFFILSLSASGPDCLGPGKRGVALATGQYTVQTVHLMQWSKLMFSSLIMRSGPRTRR